MGRDKAVLQIDGEALPARSVRCLRQICDPVIVASGQRLLEAPGCLVAPDPAPGRGPLAGLVAALRASPRNLCAVVTVDRPDLEPVLLREPARADDDHDALVPVGPNDPEPLHAVYGRSALPVAVAALASDDRSMKSLIGRFRVLPVRVAGAMALRFSVNWNRLEDISAWRPVPAFPR